MTPLSLPPWRLTRVGIGIKLTVITCGSGALAAITDRTPVAYRVDRGGGAAPTAQSCQPFGAIRWRYCDLRANPF